MQTVAKLQSSRGENERVFLNVLEPVDGKEGWMAYLNQSGNTPSRRLHLFLRQHEGRQWFEVTGPMVKLDEQGNALTRPRTNEDGQFLGRDGNVVSNENQAAQEYVYVTDQQDNVVFANLGSLNVNNEKTNGEKTKVTLGNLSMMNDADALVVAREVAVLRQMEKSSEEYQQQESKVKQAREQVKQKEGGMQYHTLFVEEGADFLRNLGFEVRLGNNAPAQQSQGNAPASQGSAPADQGNNAGAGQAPASNGPGF